MSFKSRSLYSSLHRNVPTRKFLYIHSSPPLAIVATPPVENLDHRNTFEQSSTSTTVFQQRNFENEAHQRTRSLFAAMWSSQLKRFGNLILCFNHYHIREITLLEGITTLSKWENTQTKWLKVWCSPRGVRMRALVWLPGHFDWVQPGINQKVIRNLHELYEILPHNAVSVFFIIWNCPHIVCRLIAFSPMSSWRNSLNERCDARKMYGSARTPPPPFPPPIRQKKGLQIV